MLEAASRARRHTGCRRQCEGACERQVGRRAREGKGRLVPRKPEASPSSCLCRSLPLKNISSCTCFDLYTAWRDIIL